MIEKPKTYEEAKIILKSEEVKQVNEYLKKMAIRRMKLFPAFLFTSLNLIVTAPAIYMQDPGMIKIALLTSTGTALMGLAGLIPDYISRIKLEKSINDGSYIANNSEEEVIKKAQAFVDDYYLNGLDREKKPKDELEEMFQDTQGEVNDNKHVASR